MNKILCNLLCCFIPKKKNRDHFRTKYCKKIIKIENSSKMVSPISYQENSNIIKNTNPHLCKFEGIGQTEIAYIHECYWANIFRDTIQNSEWLLNKSFSPGRAALSYVSLYVLYRILNDIKPSNILECGLGQSSRMTI